MSAQNDAIRRQLGFDLAAAEREECARHPVRASQKVVMDARKQADELCGVDAEMLKGVVLG